MAGRDSITQVVDAYFASISSGDVEAFLATFAEDGASRDPLGAPVHRGHAELRRLFEGTRQFWDDLRVTAHETFIAGGGAATRWAATGRRDGVEVRFAGIDVFAFDAAGRILEVTAYWDLEGTLEQLRA